MIMRHHHLLRSIALFAAVFLPFPIDAQNAASCKRLVGYFFNMAHKLRNYQVNQIPVKKLTHIHYAFAKVDTNYMVQFTDPEIDIQKSFPGDTSSQEFKGLVWQINNNLKKDNPKLRTVITIGGYADSERFSDIAADPKATIKFVESAIAFMQKYKFDGIELSWLYPVEGGEPENSRRPEDGTNFIRLLRAFRNMLDAQTGRRRILAVALPAGPNNTRHLNVPEIDNLVDYANILTHDYFWAGSNLAGHHTNLFPSKSDPSTTKLSVAGTVDSFLNNGLSASKIHIAVALYGHMWRVSTTGSSNGLYQKVSSVPAGIPATQDPGVINFRDIFNQQYQGWLGSELWDDDAKAPYIYNKTNNVLISFDNPSSATAKGAYAMMKGLGGVFFWDLGSDYIGTNVKHAKRQLKTRLNSTVTTTCNRQLLWQTEKAKNDFSSQCPNVPTLGGSCDSFKDPSVCSTTTSFFICVNNKWVTQTCPGSKTCKILMSNEGKVSGALCTSDCKT